MEITFHGAARTVTGSQHLIEANGRRILLDCGLFQGKRKESFELNRKGFCDAQLVDAIILSHAHIDHSGSIPCIVKRGFRGNIFSTFATRDLSAVMLLDSAKIQLRDVEYVNRKREKQKKNLFEPLYTEEDVFQSLKQFIGLPYDRKIEIFPGITLSFLDAGHMLGSAITVLDIQEKNSSKNIRLVFTGDLGRPGLPIIRDPKMVPDGADVLLIESTYGNRLHPPTEDLEKELQRIVSETYQRKGSLLIPAFAVERTQQVLYLLHRLHTQKRIPFLPIYVDSPLAIRATEIFLLHPELYDAELQEFLLNDTDQNPFNFPGVHYVSSVQKSKEINGLKEPAIIISASGMMENGRILHHLKYRVEEERNTILITGWQAPNTLGRYIWEQQPEIKIFGEFYQLKARVERLPSISGHADQQDLLRWTQTLYKKPNKIFIVHGEEEAAFTLAEKFKEIMELQEVYVPKMNESFSFS